MPAAAAAIAEMVSKPRTSATAGAGTSRGVRLGVIDFDLPATGGRSSDVVAVPCVTHRARQVRLTPSAIRRGVDGVEDAQRRLLE